jgi:hypothetical protein
MGRIKSVAALALGALALCAIGAASAQAITSEWMIEGAKLSSIGSKETIKITGGTVSIAVPALAVTIECKSSSGSGTLFSGGTDEISLSLSACEAPKAKTCKISPFTIKAKSELISTGGATYAKLLPSSGESFATIPIAGCALPEAAQLKGAFAAQTSLSLQKVQPLTFSEAITKTVNESLAKEKASELKLTYGVNTAYIGGEIKRELSGAKAGLAWQQARFTLLCEKKPEAGQTVCPALQYWPKETALIAERVPSVTMKFKLGVAEPTCSSAKIEGKTNSDGAAPLEGTLTAVAFTCNSNCAVTKLAGNRFIFLTDGTQSGQGSFQMPGLEFKFVCGADTCIYWMTLVDILVGVGSETIFYGGPEDMVRQAGSAGTCLVTGRWEGENGLFVGGFEYKLGTPEPTFVTG